MPTMQSILMDIIENIIFNSLAYINLNFTIKYMRLATNMSILLCSYTGTHLFGYVV